MLFRVAAELLCTYLFPGVAQGLRQGRGFSPLWFNIFFAAVTTVALQSVSTGADILADLVRVDEGVSQEEGDRERSIREGDEGRVGVAPLAMLVLCRGRHRV